MEHYPLVSIELCNTLLSAVSVVKEFQIVFCFVFVIKGLFSIIIPIVIVIKVIIIFIILNIDIIVIVILCWQMEERTIVI